MCCVEWEEEEEEEELLLVVALLVKGVVEGVGVSAIEQSSKHDNMH